MQTLTEHDGIANRSADTRHNRYLIRLIDDGSKSTRYMISKKYFSTSRLRQRFRDEIANKNIRISD